MLTSLPSLSRLNTLAGGSQPQQQQQQMIMSQGSQQQGYQNSLYPQLPGLPNQAQTQGYAGNGYGSVAQPQGTFGQQPQPQPQNQLTFSQGGQGYFPYPIPNPGPSQSQAQQSYPSANQLQSSNNQLYARPAYVPQQMQTSLQPQQLESVAKDEDPLYGPLARARGKVERALTGDIEISPDLADALAANLQPQEQYIPSPSGTTPNAFAPCRVTKRTPLPDALHQELNYKHLTAKMGLFPDIERAWFTVDNKLFLWDYSDGRDFSRYDEQDDTIQAVGLIPARKDVFVDAITHVLVICTAAKATLLGLSRPSGSREISLYHTNLSVDTPTALIDIKGTVAGRIFGLGANKDLYELDYSAESGWFFGSGTKVQLHNRSSGALANWTPSLFSAKTKEGIESFAIDALQSRIYTLHTSGELEMFDVSGTNFISKGKYSRLKHDLNRDSRQAVNIVAIAAIGGHESRRACLVAIASNGVRAYFGATPSLWPITFRRPPSEQLAVAAQSFYSSGTFIAVQHDTNAPTPQTNLTFAVPQSGRQSALRENFENYEGPVLQECVATEVIPSQVWTVVEVPFTDPSNAPSSLKRRDGIALSALPRQATTEARQFLVLATSGLFWITQPRPVDMLQYDLELEKDAAITTVRASFGRTQIAAMGLNLGASADLKNPDTLSAISTILLSSGEPIVKDGTGGKSITYSGRHDGLALTLARYLRPIWEVKVTLAAMGGRQILGVSQSLLLTVQGRLEKLRRYLDDHPFQRYQVEGEARIAWDQEEMSLHGLQLLLKQSIEAISFVLLLSDYKISDIILRLDPQTQSTLSALTFQGLLTSDDGRQVAKKLVTALIEQQIGQELGIDTLSEILQQRCGTFCQPGDVVMYKAEESIRRAEGTRDASERSESLSESLRLFSRAASSLPLSRLQEISHRYGSMGYTIGAIELPLRTAIELDLNDKAKDYVRDGKHPQDPRKGLFEARKTCYELVIESLGDFDQQLDKATANGNATTATKKRDEAYALAIASDDELFHFYLYDWHVERGLQEQLLEFDTPYIEPYLQSTVNDVEDRRDLLWKFYARREDYLPAAEALAGLATRQSAMNLHDRLYYLAQALTSAKSAASLGREDVDFTSRLQEQIDVAHVQMEVARGIENHPEMSRDEKINALEGVNAGLMQLDELYQNYARPLRLYEPILLILKTADTRIDDVCEAVWRQLLGQARLTGTVAALGDQITNLARKYFPSEAAPLDIMVPIAYAEAASIPSNSGASSQAGWASIALLDGGVPLRDLWEATTGLYENSDDEEREYYAEEVSVIASRWISNRDEIPAAEIERFASSYLLRTNGGGNLSNSTRDTRERFMAAKQAAVRY